jgi:hypothetical protein
MKGYLANMVRTARRGQDGSGEALPRPRRDLLALFDSTPSLDGPDHESTRVAANRQDAGPGAAAPAVRAAAAQPEVLPGGAAARHSAHDGAQAAAAPATNPMAAVRHDEAPRHVLTLRDPHDVSAPSPDAAAAPREPSAAAPREQPWPAARAQALGEWRAAAAPSAVRAASGGMPQPVAALPDVHVTIGRIEVSAELAAPVNRSTPPRRQTAMSLAQYEAKRRGATR